MKLKLRNIYFRYSPFYLLLFVLMSCSDSPPTCTIILPINNDTITQGNTLPITVEANDRDGEIKEIKVFIDNVGVDVSWLTPYAFELNTVGYELGVHSLWVKAFDNEGNYAEDHVDFEIVQNESLPQVITLNATNIYQNNAILNARIETNSGSVSEVGFYWSETNPFPNQEDNHEVVESSSDFKAVISNLKPATRYYFIGYAKSAFGIIHGERVSFYTKSEIEGGISFGSFYDSREEGRIYKSVKIGEQTWMAENLAYLPKINDSGGYFVYNYHGNSIQDAKSSSYYKKYGALYAYDAAQNACPEGWHLPSLDEWQELAEFIGNENKECTIVPGTIVPGTYKWENVAKYLRAKESWGNEVNATDNYGFSAIPAGNYDLEFFNYSGEGYSTAWWSSIASEINRPYSVNIFSSNDRCSIYPNNVWNITRISVRCIKNEN